MDKRIRAWKRKTARHGKTGRSITHEPVHAALTGTLPEGVGVEHLRKSLPVLWSEQKKQLGME